MYIRHVHHDACVLVSLSDSSSFTRLQVPGSAQDLMSGEVRWLAYYGISESRVSCYTCQQSPEDGYLTEFTASNLVGFTLSCISMARAWGLGSGRYVGRDPRIEFAKIDRNLATSRLPALVRTPYRLP